jgi:hypothetical protein
MQNIGRDTEAAHLEQKRRCQLGELLVDLKEHRNASAVNQVPHCHRITAHHALLTRPFAIDLILLGAELNDPSAQLDGEVVKLARS